jgi:signal transduction histidine kinase
MRLWSVFKAVGFPRFARARLVRFISIRAKLIAIVMVTTCVALLFAGGGLAFFEIDSHREALRKEMTTIAAILGENSTAALTFDNAEDAEGVLAALASQTEILAGCLYGGEGLLFASYRRADYQPPCPARLPPEPSGFRDDQTFVLQAPVLQSDRQLGTLRLVASLGDLRRRFQLFAIVLSVVLTGAALAALVLSSGLQRLVSRPILTLALTATRISEKRDYTLRASHHSEDEVGTAVGAFNQMLDRIQEGDNALREVTEQLRTLNTTLEERVAERTAAAEQRATELKRSNEELEQFAYVASHDLQEPLRAVASYTQLLRQRFAGKIDEDTELYLTHVLAGAARMRALINDLLDYSRLGQQSLNRSAVDTAALLDTALADLHPTLSESAAQVRHGPLPVVSADASQLGQLFRNLLSNAVHFRSQATPVVDIRAERAGNFWQFAVQDNGIGIDRRHHEKIFVIFQRLHGRDRPGTGIGLAICRKIVERHGGRIWVESEPGQGSTFLFTLPADMERPT